ncbi:RNA-directed DNA polymerase, eukaryota [Tanacetum coccineum]
MGSYVLCFLKSSKTPHENSDFYENRWLLLDDSCIVEKDLSLALMGKVKDVGSLPNLYPILAKEGFKNLSIRYLWVIIEFQSIIAKQKFSNHVGVGSWFGILNPASNSFIVDERVVWVDIEGIPINAWTQNTFSKIAAKWGELLDLEDSDDKSWYRKRLCIKMKLETIISESFKVIVKGKESMGGRMGGVFGEKVNEQSIGEDSEVERVSESSFVNGHTYMHENMSTGDESIENNLPYPPGFTPLEEEVSEQMKKVRNSASVGSGRENTKGSRTRGGSILELMDELVKVEQTMGYNMDGCMKNMEDIIDSQGVDRDVTEKRTLWDYLSHVINRWDGESVVMGDFNEVRSEAERFGSIFNAQGAHYFNNSISLAGMLETFQHLSAVCLDRHLSDHRPILMREVCMDYGPIPFRFYHSWFQIEGFDKLVEDSWKEINIFDSNPIVQLKKKLQTKVSEIDIKLDQGGSSLDILNERTKLVKDLQELDNIEALEVAQKAKVRWSIEGDENTKYFHDQIHLEMSFPRMLSEDQLHELESHVTNEEIKRAVWACGVNKSPGPDGFTFEFFRRWRGWIQGCLKSSMGSVLVNGSPTTEFEFHKDDAVFVGEWKDSNLRTIVHVLRCFYLASGLRLNIHKSKLMGIGVDTGEVVRATKVFGCSTFTTPFTYLGVMVGGSMSRFHTWDEVIRKISSRLSRWKLKNLSIDRRKFFNGSEGNERKMMWMCWDKVLDSKKKGDTFRRLLMGGEESEQYVNICNRLEMVQLSQMHDRWFWSLVGTESLEGLVYNIAVLLFGQSSDNRIMQALKC